MSVLARSRPDMALEVTREVRLVAEADVRGDLGDWLSLEESLPRRLDPSGPGRMRAVRSRTCG